VEAEPARAALEREAGHLRDWNRPGRWVLTALIVILLEALCFWGRSYDPKLARENGPMENFQAICLTSGILLFLWTAWRGETAGRRCLAIGLALFYITFLVLELDVRRWGIEWLNAIFNGWPRNLWLGTAWVVTAVLVVRRWPAPWLEFRAWFVTYCAAVLLLAGLCWILASGVDKGFLGEKSLFSEELFEVAGAWLMLQSAFGTARWPA